MVISWKSSRSKSVAHEEGCCTYYTTDTRMSPWGRNILEDKDIPSSRDLMSYWHSTGRIGVLLLDEHSHLCMNYRLSRHYMRQLNL